MKLETQKGIRLFSKYFLLTLILWGSMTIPIYQIYESQWKSIYQLRETSYLTQAKFIIANELERFLSEILFINSLATIEIYLRDYSPADKRVNEALVTKFVTANKRYLSVTILDASGIEKIKVESLLTTPKLIPESELQDRSSTNFFRAALTAVPNQILVLPPMVLESVGPNGTRYFPVFPLVLSKYNSDGEMLGAVLFHYDLRGLFGIFLKMMSAQSDHQAVLIDEKGNVLAQEGSKAEDLLKYNPISYKDEHPDIWAGVSKQSHGYFKADNGVVHYSDLTEINRYQLFNYTEGLKEETIAVSDRSSGSWRIILFTPDEVLASYSFFNQPMVRWGYALLLVVTSLLALVYTRYRVAKLRLREREDFQMQEHLRLYEEAPCGYCSIDTSGLVIRANHALLAWLGYQESELINRIRIQDIMTNCAEDVLSFITGRLESTTDKQNVDLDFIRNDGTLLPSTLYWRGHFDSKGVLKTVDFSVIDATDRRKVESLLSLQASTDELTNLKNRRAFFEVAAIEWSRANRYGRPLTVVLIDVDNFKQINDTYGHAAGDKVLKRVALTFKNCFRRDTYCARYGGDEFVALLPETTVVDARIIAERFRNEVQGSSVEIDTGLALGVTVSLGLASVAENDRNIHSVINKADEALYHAKGEGRNKVVIYNSLKQSTDA